MSILPSVTLYVNNLNDKIQKEELKRNLYSLFSTYGTILDIVAKKTPKDRGQAFIVFSNIPSSTAAMKALQNFNFLGKEMRIDFAKTKSNIIKQLEGNYSSYNTNINIQAVSNLQQADKREREEEEIEEEEIASKKPASKNLENGEETNRILYIENLPKETTEELVSYLFQQYAGYKEVRMVPGRPDLAFAEFENAAQAAIAKEVLDGFMVSETNKMKITYAKK